MAPDFTETELKLIHEILNKRYREEKETQLADVELALNPDDQETVDCPSIYWHDGACHFILTKVEKNKFTSQFIYENGEQYGTGKTFHDDLVDCLYATLQIQADYEREKAMRAEKNS